MKVADLYPEKVFCESFYNYILLDVPENFNYQTKLQVLCSVCDKAVEVSVAKLSDGQKPCACGKNYYHKHERKMRKIDELSKERNVRAVQAGQVEKSGDKVTLECQVCFQIWSVEFSSFVYGGRGCPVCARQYRYTDEEYIRRVNDVGQQNKFHFEAKLTDSKLRMHSKINLRCEICSNIWPSLLSNCLSSKYSCPSCSTFGFNPTKRSVLYLLSVEDSMGVRIAIKCGISNNIKSRLENIRGCSPSLVFKVLVTWGYEDGLACRKHEAVLKSLYSNYLSKEIMADGYTETVAPAQIMEIFNLQNKNYREKFSGHQAQ